jgi:pimeloyl-ACP methyl ester carboxylesterase
MMTTLFETTVQAPRGVVLVTHGLNNKPEAMDALIRVLVREGLHCLRISLYRDAPDAPADSRAITDGWISDFTQAYDELRARYPLQPIYNVGYSLGALVAIRCLQIRPALTFDRMVLLAPPVAITRSANLVRLLTPLARLGLALPSVAPAEIRARRGTPLAEYAAMFGLVDAVQTLDDHENIRNIQTRVFLDAEDKMVRYAGVLDWIATNRLAWVAETLRRRLPTARPYRHLMISETSLGRPAWEDLTADIVTHFTEPAPVLES